MGPAAKRRFVIGDSGKSAYQWGVAAPKTESRWPAALTVIAAAALNFVLPGKFTLGPTWLVPVLEFAILIPLMITAPRRVPNESRGRQAAAVSLIAIANVANVATSFPGFVSLARAAGLHITTP